MEESLLWKKSAKELITLLKNKSISPSEALNANLDRIKETHEDINAVVTICEERAKSKIKELQADAPDLPGYLHGLPVLIKDLTEVKDVKTTFGSKIYENNVSTHSDFLVEKIEKMGGIVLGKTNTPEFGAGSNTFNEVFGITANPWNIAYTAGGSSGGTASALAAGAAWLGTGSDLGGSLRNPASFCGVVGLRPTIGTVAHGPTNLPFNDLSVDGPMARNVEDISILLDTMSGLDSRDPLSSKKTNQSFQEEIYKEKSGLNIGVTDDYNMLACHPEVRESINHAEKILKQMGHNVTRVSPDFTHAEETFQILRAHLLSSGKRSLYESHKDVLKEDLRLNIEKGMKLQVSEIDKAKIFRGEIINKTNVFFKEFDILIAPSSMVPPFDKNTLWPEKVEDKTFDNYVSWLMTAATISITGCPALAVPCNFSSNNLPIGIQIVGQRRQEAMILNLGYHFEKQTKSNNLLPIDPIK